jgi:hypothetical protein
MAKDTISILDGSTFLVSDLRGDIDASPLIAHGLARYGFREEAARVALATLEAATFFRYRLPEVFAGYRRGRTSFPVEYPTASSPQTWATGTPLLLLRVLLGLEPDGDELQRNPYPARHHRTDRARGNPRTLGPDGRGRGQGGLQCRLSTST